MDRQTFDAMEPNARAMVQHLIDASDGGLTLDDVPDEVALVSLREPTEAEKEYGAQLVGRLGEPEMSDPPRSKQRPLRSALAAVQHDIWAHWMRYLFSVGDRVDDGSVLIPADKVKRWERQIHADYDDLSEEEQASDLEQADKVLSVFDVVAYDAPEYMKGPEWDEWLEDSARTLVGEDKRWGLMSSRGACKLVSWVTIADLLTRLPEGEPFVFTVTDRPLVTFELERLARREARLAREAYG